MASKIDIFNMALFHVGSTSKVANESEQTMERIACSTFYDTVLDVLLTYKAADWSFATRSTKLALLDEPPTNWRYRYAYPNDCVRAIGLVVPGDRNPPEQYKPPYVLREDAAQLTLCTDQPEAELLYITRSLPAERFPAPFVEALALRLGSFIAMPLKKEASLRDELVQRAEQSIQMAIAHELNQAQPSREPESDYITEMHA